VTADPHPPATNRPAPAETPDAAPQGAPPEEAEEAPGTAEQTPPPEGGRAEARELEHQLDEARQLQRAAEARAQENLDRWQRAQADLANYRRRAQFEREELEEFAANSLVASLLPVLDSFDRAWSTLPGQFRHLTWLSGVAMIHSQLRGTLERIGLLEIEAEGKPFDPTLHEAVDSEPGDGPPHVVAVLQAGYKLHERVLRPALVKVGPKSEAPGPKSDSDEAAPEATSDVAPQGASEAEAPPEATA
jgi:molecular chaperone GrpE